MKLSSGNFYNHIVFIYISLNITVKSNNNKSDVSGIDKNRIQYGNAKVRKGNGGNITVRTCALEWP